MIENPYQFKGPLDPKKNGLVCIPRAEDVHKVIDGILKSDYWAILGPRQIGKTTFLRLVQHEFKHAYYIYIDFELHSKSKEADIYPWLMEKMLSEIPNYSETSKAKEWKSGPEQAFFGFLRHFKPKDDDLKVVFLFDEIDALPFVNDFLHFWRGVFHERYSHPELEKYIVITSGAADLIELSLGPSSPFNIAQVLYLHDFSGEESELLIDRPFKELGIQIEPGAKDKLLSSLSGHPQMLQHAGHILVDQTLKSGNSKIYIKNVDGAIQKLFKTNSSLDTLKQDLKDEKLRDLIEHILEGHKEKFHPYKEYSLRGAGTIVERDSFCSIRNRVFEEFLYNIESSMLKINEEESEYSLFVKKPWLVILIFAVLLGSISGLTSFGEGIIAAIILIVFSIFFMIISTISLEKSSEKKEECQEMKNGGNKV